MHQRVIRRLFNRSESCRQLDSSFPIGVASKDHDYVQLYYAT